MKPRTIASRPEISITASRTRSRIVIGIGWSGPHQSTKPRIGVVGAPLAEGHMAHPARPAIVSPPSRAGCIVHDPQKWKPVSLPGAGIWQVWHFSQARDP